jgi:hypothetical protein
MRDRFAPRGTLLMPHHPPSIIIITPLCSAYRIRNSLINSGVITHVFNSYAAALILLQRKRIDTVVTKFATDAASLEFCDAVRRLNIPLVYSSAPVDDDDLRQYEFDFSVLQRPPSLHEPRAARQIEWA